MRIEDRTQQKSNPRPAAWEYRTATMDIDADLTQYGQDGWELVSVVPVPYDPMNAVFYFKRRRQM